MIDRPRTKLWSVGGGKGGVGKSIFTLGLAVCLADLGKKIVLIDGDLGGANLHTLLGVRYPEVTLEDFLLRRVSRLEDTIISTQVSGINLISGADDILGAANPTYAQKIRLVQQIEELPADYVFLDLGAGTSYNTLDLFNHFPGKITVLTGQVTSLQNVYGFIKSALYRKLSREFARDEKMLSILYQMGGKDGGPALQSIQELEQYLKETMPKQYAKLARILEEFHLFLIINMVKSDQDLRSAEIIRSVCADYLSIKTQILGHLPFDQAVDHAVNKMDPLALYKKKNQAGSALQQIAREFLFSCRLSRSPAPRLKAAATS